MIRFDQWMLPDGEAHLQEWMSVVNRRRNGRLTYQDHKFEAAQAYAHKRRVAVDIGAHVGLWSRTLAEEYREVIAFEPVSAHRACFRENLSGFQNVRLEPVALGAEAGTVRIINRTPGSSGDTGVDPRAERSTLRASVATEREGGALIECRTLDSYRLPILDFLKVDTEGFEVFVLEGAEETLDRCHPVVIVEQKKETGMMDRYGVGPRDAVDLLIRLGAKERKVIQGDYICSWDS